MSSYKRGIRIIESVREAQVNSPRESPEPEFRNARSVNRLYRGLQVKQSTPPELVRNPLHNYSNVSDSDHSLRVSLAQIQGERQELSDLLGTLRSFQDIRFEMELNHEVARGALDVSPSSVDLGSYYKLSEKVREVTGYFEVSQEVMQAEFKQLTEHLREILRSLRTSSMHNEAVILELFWRSVVKLVDTEMWMHRQDVRHALLDAEIQQRALASEWQTTTQLIKDDSHLEITKHLETINRLQDKLAALQTDKRTVEGKLIEREYELSQVTKLDAREDAVRDMNGLMKKLNAFIKDSESEAYRQVITLKNISDVMSLAALLDDKAPVKHAEAQTDWTVHEQSFPLLTKPLTSIHPWHFFEGIEAERSVTELDLTALFESVITQSAGSKPFWLELIEAVEGINPAELWNSLHNQSTSSAKLMLKLLGKDGMMPKQLSLYLSKLAKQFDLASKGEPTLGLGLTCDLIANMLPRGQAEAIASRLTLEGEEISQSDMLLLRFVLAVEKTRKPFQYFSSVFASLSRERLSEMFVAKVKMIASQYEIDSFFDSLAIKNTISMHSFQETVKFDERLLKARTVKINKSAFLLAAATVWQTEFTSVLGSLRATAESDVGAFGSIADAVSLTGPNSLCALLKTPIETDCLVLADLLEMTPIKLNERKEVRRRKKKPAK
jgi:hypothetical protein